jgi:hypothetical protein
LNQTGLDNIPASAIEKLKLLIIPSAKYDANGNAGIINIIYKKNKQNSLMEGWFYNRSWFTLGTKENLPTIRPQYTFTPKKSTKCFTQL